MPLMSGSGAALKLVAVQCTLAGWPSPRDWAHAIIGLVAMAAIALAAALLSMQLGWLPR